MTVGQKYRKKQKNFWWRSHTRTEKKKHRPKKNLVRSVVSVNKTRIKCPGKKASKHINRIVFDAGFVAAPHLHHSYSMLSSPYFILYYFIRFRLFSISVINAWHLVCLKIFLFPYTLQIEQVLRDSVIASGNFTIFLAASQ